MSIFDDIEEETPGAEAIDTSPLPKVESVQQMDALIATLFERRAVAEAKKADLAEVNKDIGRLEGQVVMALRDFNRKSYKSPQGSVSVVEKWRVNTPKTTEDKKKFFSYLKSKGVEVMWSYTTVNSNALTSFYLEEWGIAKEKGEGLDFELPGIGPAKLHESLQVKKG